MATTASGRFKPWRGPAIATGSEILSYLDEVIAEDGLDDGIRYLHRVTAASWSTADRRWTVEVTRTDTGERAASRSPWTASRSTSPTASPGAAS
jgi:monooxygenase